MAAPSLHNLRTGRKQIRTLIGALYALHGVTQRQLRDLAGDTGLCGP